MSHTDEPRSADEAAVYLKVFPMITVLAATEQEAAAKIEAMEQALIAVNPCVAEGDLFEEVWICTEDGSGEHEDMWSPPAQPDTPESADA